MQVTFEDVAKAVDGEMCGGVLKAVIDGQHHVLGHKHGTHFEFTKLGQEIANGIEEAAVKAALEGNRGGRGGRTPKPPKAPKPPKGADVPDTDPETEDEPDETGEPDDQLTAAELLGG